MSINPISSVTPVNPVYNRTQGEPQSQPKELTSQENGSTQPTKKELHDIINGINNMLIPSHTSSKFVFHEKLNDYYVQVVDDQTNEVVREIPSKKFLDMYADMLDFMGIFVNRKI